MGTHPIFESDFDCLTEMVKILQSVGDRILVTQKDRLLPATVRFVGSLPGKEGDWYGVEYDEPYGKHDGSHEGTSYFQCARKFGSFVRPQKILSEISVADAIKVQYSRDISMEEKIGEMNSSQIFIKEKPLNELKSISVTDLPVSAMPEDTLPELCPKLHSFDCSNTRITTFAELNRAISRTKVKLLTASRLQLLVDESLRFETVENLILCNCGYSVKDLRIISTMFPNLKHLNLSGNSLINLDADLSLPRNLEFLDLSRNKIGQWSQFLNIVKNMPNLREVNLSECEIYNLYSNNISVESLEILILSKNPIQSLQDFDRLNISGHG